MSSVHRYSNTGICPLPRSPLTFYREVGGHRPVLFKNKMLITKISFNTSQVKGRSYLCKILNTGTADCIKYSMFNFPIPQSAMFVAVMVVAKCYIKYIMVWCNANKLYSYYICKPNSLFFFFLLCCMEKWCAQENTGSKTKREGGR